MVNIYMNSVKFEKINNIVLKKDWGKENDKKEVLENQYDYFGNIKFPSIIIMGTRGRGKTSLCILLIREALMTTLSKLVIFSSTINDDIEGLESILPYTSIYEKIYKKDVNLLAEKYEEAKERYKRVKNLNDKYVFPNVIFYLDDLKDVDTQTMDIIKDMFVNGRHHGIIILLSQHDYNEYAIPVIRKNTDILIIFGGFDEDTVKENIYPLISGDFTIKKKDFYNIYKEAVKKDEQIEPPFLMVNKIEKEMRKRFNEKFKDE